MKYRFIAVLHNLKLDGIKNRGVEIFPGARVSNSSDVVKQTITTQLANETLGFHSINEFKDNSYIYIDGELETIATKIDEEDFNKRNSHICFALLRKVQFFIACLWKIKDNNVYIRDGFLIIYDGEIEDGMTYKSSLSEVFSNSDTKMNVSHFSDHEIRRALTILNSSIPEAFNIFDFGGKKPSSDHLYKNKEYNRIDRAEYFVISARRNAIIPMKIMSYCNALECLFTTSKTEVNHKISERVAALLGSSLESRKKYFKIIKNAYTARSSIVHGQTLSKESDDILSELSRELDKILRELIVGDNEVFYKNDKEIEEFFTDLLFS